MRFWKFMQILWPGFLCACMLEMVFFAVFDPSQMQSQFISSDNPTQLIYTGSFFVFWSATALSSFISFLLMSEPDGKAQKPKD